ncbi:MAG: hypothetical protein H6849_03585 [Alphaproteobacteria bacterium]|nr:MAG: hypothetical protein H6849_03585 [Alphaproteobacteria bacterium]
MGQEITLSLALRSRHARIVGVQTLFVAIRDDTPARNLDKSITTALSKAGADTDTKITPDSVVLRRIVSAYDDNREKIWEIVSGHLPEAWPLKRVDPVIKAILGAALAEAFSQKTPGKVILREYTTIADSFFSHKEIDFIHSIISGMLQKTGYLENNTCTKDLLKVT